MSRSIVRLVGGALLAAFVAALSACSGMGPTASAPDPHDYVGGTD